MLNSLTQALPEAFLDYFMDATGVASGNLKVYHCTDSEDTSGYQVVLDKESLHSILENTPVYINADTQLLARYEEDTDSCYLRNFDLGEAFLDFVKNVDIELFVRSFKTRSLSDFLTDF